MDNLKMEFGNAEEQLAWDIIETTHSNLFLTGRAGTGKTTFLHRLQTNSPKRMIVVAPTGIAAINAGGMTLHSFFQLPFSPFIPDSDYMKQNQQFKLSKAKIKLIRSLDLVVIDEISMVRADLLDAVDDVLRRYRRSKRPFGGVQMVMIGDLGQLSPVVMEEEWAMLSRYYDSPYFFSSRALRSTRFSVVELKHVYRQSDARFLNLLNSIRENRADATVLQTLNARYKPNFNPQPDEGYIRLTTHNAQAQAVNDRELNALPAEPFTFEATVEGKFPEMIFPTEQELVLKEGAQVMFVKNDSSPQKRYYNGMIGVITSIDEQGFSVQPKHSDEEIEVSQEEWTNSRYVLNDETKEIEEVVEGRFKQYPVKLAWAITIHKSQGLTFDRAIIDASHAFAHGQTYVALSRCRTIEGLVLSSPIPASAIIRDNAVDDFSTESKQLQPDANGLQSMQREYFVGLIDELFDFSDTTSPLYSLSRLYTEHLSKKYPKASAEMKAISQLATEQLLLVASRFHEQYVGMVQSTDDYVSSANLQERIQKGSKYFSDRLNDIAAIVKKSQIEEIGNKEVKERYTEYRKMFDEALALHLRLLRHFSSEPFSTASFLHEKAMALLDDKADGKKRKQKDRPEAAPKPDTDPTQRDLLTASLKAWRKAKAEEKGLPAYVVLPQKSLEAIVDYCPRTLMALSTLYGMGAHRVENYGEEILQIVAENI